MRNQQIRSAKRLAESRQLIAEVGREPHYDADRKAGSTAALERTRKLLASLAPGHPLESFGAGVEAATGKNKASPAKRRRAKPKP